MREPSPEKAATPPAPTPPKAKPASPKKEKTKKDELNTLAEPNIDRKKAAEDIRAQGREDATGMRGYKLGSGGEIGYDFPNIWGRDELYGSFLLSQEYEYSGRKKREEPKKS